MAGEWTTRKIGALGRVVTGKTPATSDPSFFGGSYPFITIPDLDGRRLIDRTARTLSEGGANAIQSCKLPQGSVMMSCIATIGKCGVTTRASFTNQQINSVIPGSDIDPGFLYYVFSQLSQELFAAGGGGSVYTNVSKSRFADIEVFLPTDISEQRAIAHILGTLDDKIELNRRMSETLECMARALFKSWFVDFEPVTAKAEGRWRRGESLPGLPAHLWDLFPDSFEDSELGEIPKGWKVGAVSDLADVSSGKRPAARTTEASPEASAPLWGGNGPMAFVPEPLISDPILLTGRVGTLGSVFRISTPCWPSDNTLVVRANRPCMFEYLFFQLQQIDYASLNRGSTQPLLTQTDLKSQRIILPISEVLEHYSRFAGTAYKRIDDIEAESRTLATFRDTLLPKLISGELRVEAADKANSRIG